MQRRLTDKERKCLSDYVEAFDRLKQIGCYVIASQALEMLHHNTTDGLPFVEPELTDEDARSRPWVMVRDAKTEPWCGPYVLVCKTGELFGYAAALQDFSELGNWIYCRRATPEEIAAAGLEVTE